MRGLFQDNAGFEKLADIASASIIATGPNGSYHHVTGTTSISAILIRKEGSVVLLQFTGTLTVVHNTGILNLLGNLDLSAVKGTMSAFISEGAGEWTELFRHAVPAGGDFGLEIDLGAMPAFPTVVTPTVVATAHVSNETSDRNETMPAFPTFNAPEVIDNGAI